MNLAQRIQKHRRLSGQTQEELAEALGVSHQSVSKWESGQTMPGLEKVVLLSEYFQVSTDYLLKGESMPERDEEDSDILCDEEAIQEVSPATLDEQPDSPSNGKPRLFFYAGMILTASGMSIFITLCVLSFLYPPYLLGKTPGPLDMLYFYLRYHGLEELFIASIAFVLIGTAILIIHGLKRRHHTTDSRT